MCICSYISFSNWSKEVSGVSFAYISSVNFVDKIYHTDHQVRAIINRQILWIYFI